MKVVLRDIVGAAIISSDGKVILGRSAPKDKGVYSGSWVVPGGGIEEGETKLEALRREMLEETLIDIEGYDIEFVREGFGESEKKLKDTGEMALIKMKFFDYVIHINDKTSTQLGTEPTEELVELKWFTKDEINIENVSKPTREFLELVDF